MTKSQENKEQKKIWNIKKDVLIQIFIEEFSNQNVKTFKEMNVQLFNCFRKLFEMINEDNGCISFHKASGIARVKNYSALQGIPTFWNIIDLSTN